MRIFETNNKREMPAFYQLSLKKVEIKGDVMGKFGTFTIEQTFINNKNNPLEVNYTFPITETAAVTGFTVKVGEKEMHGICKEKEEAHKEYIDNLSKGNSAYLLDQDTANVFNVMVGKVLPGEEVKIIINYLDTLSILNNKARLIIPTLVNQRYKSEITDGLKYGKVNYTVDFKIKVHKMLNYTNLKSINHSIKQIEKADYYLIEADNYDMSRDFVLDMYFNEILISNACYENTDDGKKIVLLNFMPEIKEEKNKSKEYIFVVDVSGSMGSSGKIEKTKDALKRCLKELKEGDKFNIIPFESEYDYFCFESVEATERKIQDAFDYIDDLEAGGGTEILEPIKFALYERPENRVVIVLTDGEVGNENEIVNYISKNIFRARLFAIGIDTSVNTAFIKAMAKVGNGKAEFIYPGEDMEEAIVRTFARIQSPLVKNMKIDYGENRVITEVKDDISLFNHEYFQTIAMIENLDDDITLKGFVGDKEYTWKIAKEDMELLQTNLRLVYAKKQIDEYEEQIRSYEHEYNNKNARRMVEEYKQKIIEVSCKYNIASKYTSFISVNEREEKSFGPVEFENIALSGAELYDIPQDRACFSIAKAGARKFARNVDACMICEPGVKEREEELDKADAELKILRTFVNEWKTLDFCTFLLSFIYVYKQKFQIDLIDIFKKYLNDHSDELDDENVQKLLLYMYRNNMMRKEIGLDSFKEPYKKLEVTRAKLNYNLHTIDYGEDKSPKLEDRGSLREEVLKML